MVLGHYGAVLVDIWWYMVSRRQHWLVVGGAGSVWVGTNWLLVVWVSITWYCLVLSKTGLVQGFYDCIDWKSEDLVKCYHSRTDDKRTNEQGKKELLSQWTMEDWDGQNDVHLAEVQRQCNLNVDVKQRSAITTINYVICQNFTMLIITTKCNIYVESINL